MTIELSSTPSMFAGFSLAEKRMLAIAVRRAEELEETRRVTAILAAQARDIESDLRSRGVTDEAVLREAREAVEATSAVHAGLAGEVHDYRTLFGPQGRATAALGQFVTTLRIAHAGDVDALNRVQAARRELHEARDAAAGARVESHGTEAPQPAQLRGLDPRAADSANVIAAARPPRVARESQSPLPSALSNPYARGGASAVMADRAGEQLLVDDGTRLELALEYDVLAIKAALEIAEAREWRSVYVSGSPGFREAVRAQAALRGIAIAGRTPAGHGRGKDSDRSGRPAPVPRPLSDDALAAFQRASTPGERRAAAERYPELSKAFAIEASYRKLAARLEGAAAQKAFMRRVRELLAADIAQGRELVELRLRGNVRARTAHARARGRLQDR